MLLTERRTLAYHTTCRQSVLNRPPEVFYKNQLLKPYVFFDVSDGTDVVAKSGDTIGSRRNQVHSPIPTYAVHRMSHPLRDAEALCTLQQAACEKSDFLNVSSVYSILGHSLRKARSFREKGTGSICPEISMTGSHFDFNAPPAFIALSFRPFLWKPRLEVLGFLFRAASSSWLAVFLKHLCILFW